MSYRQKKHYPDMAHVRRQAKAVCAAVQELAGLGIEVVLILFRPDMPVIEVANCPSVMNLRGEDIGQGGGGEAVYIKRAAVVCGCRVVWSEVL